MVSQDLPAATGLPGSILRNLTGLHGEPSTLAVLGQVDSGNARALPSLCMGHMVAQASIRQRPGGRKTKRQTQTLCICLAF